MKTPASVPGDQCQLSAQIDLTPDEIMVLTHFRNMDDRSQAFMLRYLPAQAVDCPRRAAPRLRLIDGRCK